MNYKKTTIHDVFDASVDEAAKLGARVTGSELVGLVPLEGEPADRSTPEVREGCVGCGVCEMICPAEPEAAIVVEARREWDRA